MKIEKKGWHEDKPVMWEYEVKLWNDLEGKMVHRQGVTFGRSFVEAMANVDASYGDYAEDIMIHSLIQSVCYDFDTDGEALAGAAIANNHPDGKVYNFYD